MKNNFQITGHNIRENGVIQFNVSECGDNK